MTFEEKTYSEVFEKQPKLMHDITDISATNSIFFLLSANGCYNKNHNYEWKMYSDDLTFGPISLALWGEINSNIKNGQNFEGTFSKDAQIVLHSINSTLKDVPEDLDPRKVLVGIAGYKYISQTHCLPQSAVELNFNTKMPELSGLYDYCKEKSFELESKIRVLNTQRDKTL